MPDILLKELRSELAAAQEEINGWRNQAHQSQSAFERTQEQLLSAQAEIKRLEERRCEICGYAEHHREHTSCLRTQLAAAREEIKTVTEQKNRMWFEMQTAQNQLAKAEQRVAEACALQVATETKFHWLDAARVAKEIRSGEWRKFVKEV